MEFSTGSNVANLFTLDQARMTIGRRVVSSFSSVMLNLVQSAFFGRRKEKVDSGSSPE
jgi:hypothetical protein